MAKGRKFNVEKLPKDVYEMIDYINFTEDGEMADDDVIGEGWVSDDYIIEDYTHYFTFTSRKDLIEYLREECKKVK